jgi:8-oxo-dGTP pyrophosphatase MutT (NUDIX family)
MIESTSAGGIVLNKEGKVLVVNQHGTSWSFPKGRFEPGEDALTAAKREIREESGITNLTLIKELGTYSRYKIGDNDGDDTSELKIMTMFLFKTDQEFLKPIDPKNPEARWVEKENVAGLLTHQKDKEFFRSVIF